jgi:hypothetical protein
VKPVALAALALAAPLTGLPRPTGPKPVGTTVAYLVDSSRSDSAFPAGRPITVQLWYPARAADSRARRATYLLEPELVPALLAGYYDVDSASLRSWSTLATNSALDAAPAAGSFPLVTFSVGLGVIRANYTTLAEDLASHGYVVALVESPLAGLMRGPGGRMIADTAGSLGEAAAHRAAVRAWSLDISSVLDRLERRGLAPAVAAVVDWSRIGAIGHSSGGLVAMEACKLDRRVRACVDLDGGMATPASEPLADFVPGGVSWPGLILRSHPIYTDADFARRGMTRAQWEARGTAGKVALDSLVARSPGPLTVAEVAGTGHFNFSDGPFVMPGTITRFGGKIIDPRRGRLVIGETIRAFLDHYLPRSGAPSRAGWAPRFPELIVASAGRAH